MVLDRRHLAFGYKSADALISHAHEMIIGQGEMGVTGTIRCGGQSSRVLLNFMFMRLDSSQEPTIRDKMNDWMWSDLANTFDYAGTYKKAPYIPSSKLRWQMSAASRTLRNSSQRVSCADAGGISSR